MKVTGLEYYARLGILSAGLSGRSPAEIVGSFPPGAWLFFCCECCEVDVSATS